MLSWWLRVMWRVDWHAAGGSRLVVRFYTEVVLRWCSLSTVGVEEKIGRVGGGRGYDVVEWVY
jgi:hypothetical protein